MPPDPVFSYMLAPKASPDYCAWRPTRVRVRPDSSNGDVVEWCGAMSSFGENALMGKGTCMYDG